MKMGSQVKLQHTRGREAVQKNLPVEAPQVVRPTIIAASNDCEGNTREKISSNKPPNQTSRDEDSCLPSSRVERVRADFSAREVDGVVWRHTYIRLSVCIHTYMPLV